MADGKTTIQELIDCVTDFEKQRDWEQFHSPKNLAMGLAIEVSELMEHFLWLSESESRDVAGDSKKLEQVKDEMADVFNYLLMLTHALGVDLSEAFYEKIKQNDKKYPADLYRGKYEL
ncbi:MAG: nucleotide pyrophosphohydrolase [Sedimentisphaerales bacterium]|nr:nucleotide pyrophosphohydrolase [Sedimentisphaerales bacterium]